MSTSRFLNPTSPGGLLSPDTGDELTDDEVLVVQAITAGTYFTEGEVPTGLVNGANKEFVLPETPNPSGSLLFFVNGQLLKAADDYTLSTATITVATAPPTGSNLLAVYRVSPV